MFDVIEEAPIADENRLTKPKSKASQSYQISKTKSKRGRKPNSSKFAPPRVVKKQPIANWWNMMRRLYDK